MPTHPTILWTALLVMCEGTVRDLTQAPEEHQLCASQMCDAGLLTRPDAGLEHEYTLSTNGMAALTILERFRDFTLTK